MTIDDEAGLTDLNDYHGSMEATELHMIACDFENELEGLEETHPRATEIVQVIAEIDAEIERLTEDSNR